MDARDDVKSKLSIEDVIAGYLSLKRAGRNFKALSPFSNEKTPSFIVSPEKQIWHDFSSGKGGDIFTFVMEVEGVDFKGALDILARRAGVDLEQYKTSKTRSSIDKNRLYEALELSAKFYQVQFSKNKTALDYILKTRGITKTTALLWQIGYSPNTGDALIKFLKSKGYSDKEVQLCGLSTERRSGSVDMFRGRIMIPLCDGQGRVIGYTSRTLDPKDTSPKYINTPQTVLYDKSRHIFGLHLAKPAIRESGYCVVVEGNMDVITSNQAGVKQTVATAGTALTIYHLKDLSRLSTDIRLCFDADKAGLAATERAIPLASSIKLNLSVINLPSAKDPDELIKSNPKLWQEAIDKKEYALDWLTKHYSEQIDLSTAPGKRQFTDKLLPIISALDDDVEKDHYINSIAKLINVHPEAITQKLARSDSTKTEPRRIIKIKTEKIDQQKLETKKVQDAFLCLMLNRVTLRELMDKVKVHMMVTEEAKVLLTAIETNMELSANDLLAHMLNIEDYVKIELLLYEELYNNLDLNELHYEATRLKARLIENYVKSQRMKIIELLSATNDETETRKLLGKARELDQMLNQSKEEYVSDAGQETE